MKKRLISAFLVLLVLVPIFFHGGFIFDITILILSLLGLREFLHIRSDKREIPLFITFISYLFFTFIIISSWSHQEFTFALDYRFLAGLFSIFLLPVILYHDSNIYNIEDAFYLIGGVFFLSFSFSLMILFRNYDLEIFIYLFIITIMTDTYAYITGTLIGKTPLIKDISPNKTWEGTMVGTVMGSVIATIFYHVVIDPDLSLWVVAGISIFLSIIGQFGDLVFSSIKRYFGKKDFSNIMPGHGGILDRFDSIIFVMLAFLFVITVL